MARRADRGSILQEISRINRWWIEPNWEKGDPQHLAAASASFRRRPAVLDDIAPPNVYTLRGPRRAGKSTCLKQNIARLCEAGVEPRRICYFAADSIETYRDLINVFESARQLFPDLGDAPRYFLIDEVTAISDWQRGVKWIRDNTMAASDCIVLTGSSAEDVAAGALDLSGRRGPTANVDRLLLPMSFPQFADCAGYSLPSSPKLAFGDFYTENGRLACHDALGYLGVLVDAFEAYLLVGGFPQAVSDFRRTASVSDGFIRDLWDVVRSDLRRQGVSRPEQCLSLLEQIVVSLTSTLSMQSVADRLAIDRRTASAWIDALASSFILLVLFKENGGVPDVKSLRKVYPIDPLIGRLPSSQSPGLSQPGSTKLAEAAIALAIFRSVERDAVDRFHQPGKLFYFKSASKTEIDFLVLPGRKLAESKYIDTPDRRELRAMITHSGEGLLLTRSAIDIQAKGTILPASVFSWLLDQSG
ncbi:MAG: AAA family ATPase [Dehalococcoidia bacterium]|nr:AAA family ATPase [Dehalococcoidia bacterium]